MRAATDSEITEGPLHGVASARAVVSCVLVIGRRWVPVAAGVTLTVAVAGCLGLAAQANAYVYWTANGSTFGRTNLNGTGADQQFIAGASQPRMLAVSSRYVYWASDNNTIGRANLDGSGVKQRFITGASGPVGVAVNSKYVYWANNATGAPTSMAPASTSGSSPAPRSRTG